MAMVSGMLLLLLAGRSGYERASFEHTFDSLADEATNPSIHHPRAAHSGLSLSIITVPHPVYTALSIIHESSFRTT
jgi:hypothetical protein